MTPADFRLYDVLNLLADSVDEAVAGRPGKAREAWTEARNAASALARTSGQPVAAALAWVVGTTGPDTVPDRPAELRNALATGALAVHAAMTGDRTATVQALADAAFAAEKALQIRGALAILRAETCTLCQRAGAAP